MKVIVDENFHTFNVGELPYDKAHSAIGEYHYYPKDGYMGGFYDPICLHLWRSQDGSWLITNDGSRNYLEQNRGNYVNDAYRNVFSTLVYKYEFNNPYEITFKVKPYEYKNPLGIAFNYITSRHYSYVFLYSDKIVVGKRNQDDFKVCLEKSICFSEAERTFQIKVFKDKVVISLDGIVLEAPNDKITGKCAIVSKAACRISLFKITMSDFDYCNELLDKKKINDTLEEKRSKYSKIECIHKIDLKNFGSGRQLRIANCSGKLVFFLAQHQKRIMRDSFAHLSSITAFDIEGNILWQMGKPNNSFDTTVISCDLPFQVADINNDGKMEIIYAYNFVVYICDALTGRILKQMPTPIVQNDPLVGDYPFYRLNVDAIRVADFKHLGYKGCFIIKDRYKNVWAYDENLNNIWRYNHKNTGHFPYIYDFNNDGYDEMFVGYDMVDHNGNIIFSLPMNSDHTDEIVYISTLEGNPERLYLASGNEGFNIINMDGTIYKHLTVGHAQRISIADYNKDLDGLEICVTSFWGSDGIIQMYDCDGNLIALKEESNNGNIITPVAYDGTNFLCLTNLGPNGGLVDSTLDVVVKFPSDNHPTLCAEAFDIDSDGVDEIICWDQTRMWIYKAKNYKTGMKLDRYPENSFSNYRGEYLKKLD